MVTGRLHNLLNVFKGNEISPEEQEQLFEEVFVTVTGRAVSADTNIHPNEIAMVQQIYKEVFEKEIEAGAVRSAANSELFETTPLESFVKAAGKKLTGVEKYMICDSIKHVVNADGKVGKWEIDYFNQIATALKMTPAEVAGLVDKSGPL